MLKFKWETEFKEIEIGQIPNDWKIDKLGEVSNISTGKTNVQDAVENGTYPLFDRSDIVKRSNRYLFDAEAVIVPGEGRDFKPKYYKGKFDLHQRTYAIFDFKDLDGKYLFFIMHILNSYLREFAVGSTVSSLRLPMFQNLNIYHPPLSEQSRIATVLSWFDELIENKKKQNEILEKTAMAIFKSWFIDFEPFKDCGFVNSELGRIPKGWIVDLLDKVVKFLYGRGLPKNKRKEGIYPVVGSSGIIGYHSEYLTSAPTIIIGRKGNAGSVQLLLESSFPIDTVFYSPGDTPARIIYYVYHYLKIVSLEDIGLSDTAVPGLNVHILHSIKILTPSQSILEEFHNLVQPLFQKIKTNQKQIMILRKIRDTLLPLLVFGKLRVEEI